MHFAGSSQRGASPDALMTCLHARLGQPIWVPNSLFTLSLYWSLLCVCMLETVWVLRAVTLLTDVLPFVSVFLLPLSRAGTRHVHIYAVVMLSLLFLFLLLFAVRSLVLGLSDCHSLQLCLPGFSETTACLQRDLAALFLSPSPSAAALWRSDLCGRGHGQTLPGVHVCPSCVDLKSM